MNKPLLVLANVKTYYPVKTGFMNLKTDYIKAVDDVSFELMAGETLGLVGESGCGKSTLGRTIIGLEPLTEGRILFNGNELNFKTERVSLSKQIQIVFQDPYSSLNPRQTVGKLLAEPLHVHKIVAKNEVETEVERLLELVGLPKTAKERYPHEFSGGQRQRIGIARALALRPKLIICDEPVSALDVSIQAQIMNLFKQLQQELGLTYLFIAHGLGAVKYISDRIAVMYAGKIVEIGSAEQIFTNPQHDYTKKLLNAYPVPDPRKRSIVVQQGQNDA
ncbi:ABC transporter ATP-binding protein [Kurthia sibirica]|uniref:Peptide ABC transporter ATP-binding protein n=1 Tax=Kurthia sibirica TaxID=202750 RepID=A0A2U3AJM9_9BACL|nr:ATP-binding cassette domain-containing protein [Kurthia sibirica]PWI24727.1 peptide ABC transporter ATP-binding protein [Kurthia sibirica]GEK34757.1 ABC transporter ATP-binding protein [Kurthia sibirica]